MMGNPITVQIRPSNGQVFQVEFDPENTTVKQLKEIIAEKRNGVNADSLKLVYSGRILKDDDLCTTCSTFNQEECMDDAMGLMDWFAFQRLTKVILSIWWCPTQGRRRLRHRHPQQHHPISTIQPHLLLPLLLLLLLPPPPIPPPTIKRTLILFSPDSVGFLDWMELVATISLDVVVLVP